MELLLSKSCIKTIRFILQRNCILSRIKLQIRRNRLQYGIFTLQNGINRGNKTKMRQININDTIYLIA